MTPRMRTYNGFSPQQREKHRRAMHRLFPQRSHPCFRGPCQMCGDPDSPVAPHAEDYSEPYVWTAPAMYALCATCHSRIHRRFASPFAWQAYLRHLGRGGYGADLKIASVAAEVKELAKDLRAGRDRQLSVMRPQTVKDRWWEKSLLECADAPMPTR